MADLNSEFTRIENNVATTYSELAAAGATMPTTQNTDNLPGTVATLGEAYRFGVLEELPQGTNVDEFYTFGLYSVPTTDHCNTLTGLPFVSAGRFMIYSSTGTGDKIEDGEIYINISQEWHPNGYEFYYKRAFRIDTDGSIITDGWFKFSTDNILEMGTYFAESIVSGQPYKWYYKKMRNGIIEIDIDYRFSAIDCSTALGSMYRTGSLVCTLPTDFGVEQYITCNYNWHSNGGTGAFLWPVNISNTSATFYAVRPTSSTSITGSLHLHFVGTYSLFGLGSGSSGYDGQ